MFFRPNYINRRIAAALAGGGGGVDWGDIGGTLADQTDLQTALNGKSDTSHNHNSSYYTESEVDTFLAGKANTSHNHSAADITSGTLALARGGTGQSLSDPGSNAFLIWNDAESEVQFATLGNYLELAGDGGPINVEFLDSGTSTPAITFATPGDLSVSYSTQTCTWSTMRDTLVFALIQVTFTPTYTTASGDLRIDLPFTSQNIPAQRWGTVINGSSVTFPTGRTELVPQVDTAVNYVVVRGSGSAVSGAILGATQLISGVAYALALSVIYFRAT